MENGGHSTLGLLCTVCLFLSPAFEASSSFWFASASTRESKVFGTLSPQNPSVALKTRVSYIHFSLLSHCYYFTLYALSQPRANTFGLSTPCSVSREANVDSSSSNFVKKSRFSYLVSRIQRRESSIQHFFVFWCLRGQFLYFQGFHLTGNILFGIIPT